MEDVPAPHLFRRAFHLASPAFLLYYWIPHDIGHGITRESILFLCLGTAFSIELGRIALKIPVFGLRGYETEKLSAYAWGALGLAIGFVLFPHALVIPAFCGMAWVDPLCAWARRTGRYPWAPIAAYAGVFATLVAFLIPATPLELGILTAAAVGVALVAEYPAIRAVDDDFLMTVAPLLALTPILGPVLALP